MTLFHSVRADLVPGGLQTLMLVYYCLRPQAGDVLMWDDRTLHCNASGHPGYPTPPDQLARAAVLCCMAPKGTCLLCNRLNRWP